MSEIPPEVGDGRMKVGLLDVQTTRMSRYQGWKFGVRGLGGEALMAVDGKAGCLVKMEVWRGAKKCGLVGCRRIGRLRWATRAQNWNAWNKAMAWLEGLACRLFATSGGNRVGGAAWEWRREDCCDCRRGEDPMRSSGGEVKGRRWGDGRAQSVGYGGADGRVGWVVVVVVVVKKRKKKNGLVLSLCEKK